MAQKYLAKAEYVREEKETVGRQSSAVKALATAIY